MAILDNELMFSDGQAVTGAAVVSTNVIDLKTPAGVGQQLEEGMPVDLFAQVTEAFNNITSLTVELITDDNSAMSSPTVLASSSVLLANLTLNKRLPLAFAMGGQTERYLALRYTPVGTAATTGRIKAGLMLDAPRGA